MSKRELPHPTLPEWATIAERTSGNEGVGTRYWPQVNGVSLTSKNGLLWFTSLEEAEDALVSFASRMND